MLTRSRWYQRIWLFAIMCLLVIHYARPQEIFTFLQAAKPFMLAAMVVTGLLVLGGTSILQLKHKQIQIIWMILIWFATLLPLSTAKGDGVQTLQQLAMYLPFILSVVILFNTPERMKLLIDIFLGCVTFVAIQGTFFHEGGRNQLFSMGAFLGDPNDLSLYANMMLPFAYCLFLNERTLNWKKIYYGGIAVLLVWLVINTFSRGGFVGLIITAGMLWLYGPLKKQLLILGVCGALVVGAVVGPSWIETMSTTTNIESATTQTRLTTWKASWELFLRQPWGTGINNIPSQMYKYIEHSPDRPVEYYYGDVNHSLWLTWLAEGGIIGFGLFIWLLVVNYKQSNMMRKIVSIDKDAQLMKLFGLACMASLTAYLVSGTFLTVNYYPHIWYLSAIIAAGFNTVRVRNKVYEYENRAVYR